MVFQNHIPAVFLRRFENFPCHLSILVDDRGERDDVNDPIQRSPFRVIKSETKTSQCFTATGGHCQRKDASVPLESGAMIASNLGL